MDDVFRALADPSRRLLLDSLNARNGQTLRELCAGLDMARQSVSKHLAVLEAANLVTTVRRGREKLHYLNAAPINEIAERWITRYDRGRVEALADLKRALEDPTMDQALVRLHDLHPHHARAALAGLTEPAFTERYWDITFDTDWTTGSPMTWHQRGVAIADPEQVVLEATLHPPGLYVAHVHARSGRPRSTSPRTARAARRRAALEGDVRDRAARRQQVKLTVVHDGLEPGGLLAGMISERLAARARRPQDAAGDRRAASGQAALMMTPEHGPADGGDDAAGRSTGDGARRPRERSATRRPAVRGLVPRRLGARRARGLRARTCRPRRRSPRC